MSELMMELTPRVSLFVAIFMTLSYAADHLVAASRARFGWGRRRQGP